jgi:hypothetical protein
MMLTVYTVQHLRSISTLKTLYQIDVALGCIFPLEIYRVRWTKKKNRCTLYCSNSLIMHLTGKLLYTRNQSIQLELLTS